LTQSDWSGHDHLDARFSVREKAGMLPVRSQLWPGKAQVSWKPCICGPAREAAVRGRGMGHAMVTCDACHDQLRQTTFYEPAHDSGHDPLTGWVTAADPPR
jgi:hypothetical protein